MAAPWLFPPIAGEADHLHASPLRHPWPLCIRPARTFGYRAQQPGAEKRAAMETYCPGVQHYTAPFVPRGYPSRPSTRVISSSAAGSSMVGGIVQAALSAILRIVPRKIFPDRVLGSFVTTAAV